MTFTKSIFFLRLYKLVFCLIYPKFWRPLLNGVAPSLEHREILLYLKKMKIDYIFDVGANKGQFALATSFYLTKIPLVSFEPLPNERIVYRRLFISRNSYTLAPFALGSENRKVNINITSSSDSSSILTPSSQLFKIFGESYSGKTISVDMTTLEKYYFKAKLNFNNALLKIDVQGYEFEVLKGGVNILSKFKYIMIELSNIELYEYQPLANTIKEFIINNGFELTFVYNKSFNSDQKLIQADYLFKRI